MATTTICINLFLHFILITLLLLYNITIIDFLEELAYVRKICNKKKKKKKEYKLNNMSVMNMTRFGRNIPDLASYPDLGAGPSKDYPDFGQLSRC